MIPRFRAWHEPKKIMLDVIAINFSLMEITADIETRKIYPELDYWWKETDIPFSEIVLMQSTGLKDNNRKEIYEGDIVEIHRTVSAFKDGGYSGDIEEDLTCIVELSSYMPHTYPLEWFLRDVTDDEEPENYWFSPGLNEASYEVIGNIYENPELLEGEE